jgi:thiamine-phosphate pyrophosphorylase
VVSERNRGTILQIIDANSNRLREAVRVVEEYFRFIENDTGMMEKLKTMRHDIAGIENECAARCVVDGRNTVSDPHAFRTAEVEMQRVSEKDIVKANLKRAQEAARVLEEYLKITRWRELVPQAKKIRFDLYDLEKQCQEQGIYG